MTPAVPASARFSRIALLVLGIVSLVLLAAVTLPPNSSTRIMAWPWWAGWRILLMVPPVLLLARSLFARTRPIETAAPVTWTLVTLGSIHLLSAAFSEFRQLSLLAASTVPSAICLAIWLGDRVGLTESNKRTLNVIGAAGAVFVVFSLTMWISGSLVPGLRHIATLNEIVDAEVFSVSPHGLRNDSPLGHSNYNAGVGILLLPVFCGLAFAEAGVRRILWSMAAAVCVLLLASTGSRALVLGLAGAGVFGLAAIASARNWSLRKQVATAAVSALALIILVAIVPRTRDAALSVIRGDGLHVGDRQRVAMSKVGFQMGVDHWLLGQGPGLVPKTYPFYRHTVEGGADSVLQLHSAPIQLWADTGILGVAAAGAMIALILSLAWRQSASKREAQSLMVASGASVAGYTALAITDYQFDVPIIAAIGAAVVSVLIFQRRDEPSPFLRPTVAAFALLTLAANMQATFHDWGPRRDFAIAVSALEQTGDFEAFDEAIEAVVARDPGNPEYLSGAAAAHLRMLFADPDPMVGDRRAVAAQHLLERVIEIAPQNEFARFNLGWLLVAKDPEDAVRHFREAAILAPERGSVFLGLGLAHLESGDPEKAIEAFALELLAAPISMTSPAWDAEFLQPHLAPALRRAVDLTQVLAPDGRLEDIGELFQWRLGDEAVSPEFPDVFSGPIRRGTPGIAVLKRALIEPENRRQLLATHVFVETTDTPTEEQLDVLESLLDSLGDDWLAWIKHPAGREAPFAKVFRRERVAHAMHAGNMDIPVPIDAYVVQMNGLVHMFFSSLFPEKGLPPDPAVIQHITDSGL